jgi:hypothetical protein
VTRRPAVPVVIAALAVLQHAGAFETPGVGGPGGAPFLERCAPNETLGGISARVAGGEVTAVAIVCRTVGTDGALGGSRPPRAYHGAATGAPSLAECPAGQVVRGVVVYFTDVVRGVALYCRVWSGTAFGSAGAASPTIGAVSGTMAPVACPPDGAQPAVGLGGTTTTRLAALRLVCDSPRR